MMKKKIIILTLALLSVKSSRLFAVAAPTSTNITAAAKAKNLPTLKRLLKQTFSFLPALKKNSPLHQAAYLGNVEAVNFLLSKRYKAYALGPNNKSPLHFAAEEGHPQVVSILLKKGANHNAQTLDREETPLHLVTKKKPNSEMVIVAQLVGHDANINLKNIDDVTALEQASNPDNALKTMLTSVGIYPVMDYNRNLLHYAGMTGRTDIVQFLLETLKMNSNTQDTLGNTPLHYAMIAGYPGTVKLLLGAGANKTIKNKKGQTPKSIAKAKGNPVILKLIE